MKKAKTIDEIDTYIYGMLTGLKAGDNTIEFVYSELKEIIKTKCNCQCSLPGMWHDQGCPMRYLPNERIT